jgi:hypothetical protein
MVAALAVEAAAVRDAPSRRASSFEAMGVVLGRIEIV